MQLVIGILLSFTLNTPIFFDYHPNGEIFASIQCKQCGDWYIPLHTYELTCPCDYED